MRISFFHPEFGLQKTKCTSCKELMRLVGIEPHPTVDLVELVTFECACGAVTAESRTTDPRTAPGQLERVATVPGNSVIH